MTVDGQKRTRPVMVAGFGLWCLSGTWFSQVLSWVPELHIYWVEGDYEGSD